MIFISNVFWTTKNFLVEYINIKKEENRDKNKIKKLTKSRFILYGLSLGRNFNLNGRFYNKTLKMFYKECNIVLFPFLYCSHYLMHFKSVKLID